MRALLLMIAILLVTLTGCGVEWFPPPPNFVTITTTTLPNATVNSAYSQTLAAFGGTTPFSWSITTGTLPAGLNLDAATGVISGTPTTAGTSNITVQVTDSSTPATTDTQTLTIVVSAATTPTILAPGTQTTLIAGQSVLVPVGTTVTPINGNAIPVTGTPTTITTSAGAVVVVPNPAGPATVTVVAQ